MSNQQILNKNQQTNQDKAVESWKNLKVNNLEVDGDLSVDGNQTQYIMAYRPESDFVVTGGTKLTGFIDQESNGIIFDNGNQDWEITQSGRYQVSMNIKGKYSVDSVLQSNVRIDGIPINIGDALASAKMSGNGVAPFEWVNLNLTAIYDLVEGEKIDITLFHPTNPNGGFSGTLYACECNFTMHKL